MHCLVNWFSHWGWIVNWSHSHNVKKAHVSTIALKLLHQLLKTKLRWLKPLTAAEQPESPKDQRKRVLWFYHRLDWTRPFLKNIQGQQWFKCFVDFLGNLHEMSLVAVPPERTYFFWIKTTQFAVKSDMERLKQSIIKHTTSELLRHREWNENFWQGEYYFCKPCNGEFLQFHEI